jgi:GDSL-like lipase/acylhydrolase family protein
MATDVRVRRRAALALASCLGLFALAAAAPPGDAASPRSRQIDVTDVGLALPEHGPAALLVPVAYPIQLSGRVLELSVTLTLITQKTRRTWVLHERANSGALGLPERREAFRFVHRLGIGERLTRLLRNEFRRSHLPFVHVEAVGPADFEGNRVSGRLLPDRRFQPLFSGLGRHLCSTLPQIRAEPGERVSIPLPVCGSRVRWHIDRRPEHGAARIRNGRLIYRSAARFRGRDSLRLANRAGQSATASAAAPVGSPVEIVVTKSSGVVVRALGDSVTAGFGYYDDGSLMPFEDLLSCKPGEAPYNDACSSNSTDRSNGGSAVDYAPGYGLANNVSWAAQWANAHGVTDYENVAISGSEPSEWAPGGQYYATTKRIESEDPDYLLMTIGANPLLSDMLFGVDEIGCALESDILGGFRECIEAAFASAQLRANLKKLYADLVAKTDATVYLMQYPTSIPSSALTYSAAQLAMTGKLLNREIASVAGEVSRTRLQPVAPPHFNVGIDIAPVFPSRYSCSRLGYRVDGQSVQSEPAQDELELDHPLSFCPGPADGPPWVIAGDTGIHPSAAGYAQMAAQVPAPE